MAYFRLKRVTILSKTSQGFTLVELLVALGIFAVIAVMAYSGLNTMLTVHLHTNQMADQLAHLQMTMTWLGRDIEQYVDRPIRDEYGDRQPSLRGTMSQLELTRTGWRNPAQQRRSLLQRVAYQVENNRLWRYYWWVLDRAQDTRPFRMKLLDNVTELKFRYLDENLQWHEEWPPTNWLNTYTDNNIVNPITLKALEVTLTLVDWGRITRLFRVPKVFLLTQPQTNMALP